MGVTIKDVAEAAGVSISTVSKVLNGHYSISEKTAQRVRGIMREMNYYPNASKRRWVACPRAFGRPTPPSLTRWAASSCWALSRQRTRPSIP